MRLLKRALIRDDGYPIGVPAPMHLNCTCGARLAVSDAGAVCSCGKRYDRAGWLIDAQPTAEEV